MSSSAFVAIRNLACSALFEAAVLAANAGAQEPPREWVEPQTGHRVVRLSDEGGSQSLYFHQHPFSADGRKMAFTTRHGISSVDLQTREIVEIVAGPVQMLVTGRKSGDIYYLQDGVVFAADFDTHESRLVAKLPEQFRWRFRFPPGPNRPRRSDRERDQASRAPGDADSDELGERGGERDQIRRSGDDPAEYRLRGDRPRRAGRRNFGWGAVAVNADETMLVGIGADPDGEPAPRTPPPGQAAGGRLGPRWASGAPMVLYTVDLATGEAKVIHRSHDWLNHLQMSPTDPGQILFCHEGPWHFVDRTWLIRTDGSQLTQVHRRTIDMEIAGHEFFGHDGGWVWYDLQTPRSLVFWLAGLEIETGRRRWYHLERPEWSVHYNVSPDGGLFCGDGGGPSSVANLSPDFEKLDPPQNGMWMYLFRPRLVEKTGLPAAAAEQIKAGVLESERLVDLSRHDYQLEPNGIFTPDGQRIVFRSNMHGPSHVYAVEVERSEGKAE